MFQLFHQFQPSFKELDNLAYTRISDQSLVCPDRWALSYDIPRYQIGTDWARSSRKQLISKTRFYKNFVFSQPNLLCYHLLESSLRNNSNKCWYHSFRWGITKVQVCQTSLHLLYCRVKANRYCSFITAIISHCPHRFLNLSDLQRFLLIEGKQP